MKELALHILDVAENGISAGADLIKIDIVEARKSNLLTLIIQDNGRGIPAEMLRAVTDPFVTSRTTRRVGLGLSLLEAAAKRCGGGFTIVSEINKGTTVTATFQLDHIDRAPIGNMALTLTTMICSNANVDFYYRHRVDDKTFVLDTREIKDALGELSIMDPAVIQELTSLVEKGIMQLS